MEQDRKVVGLGDSLVQVKETNLALEPEQVLMDPKIREMHQVVKEMWLIIVALDPHHRI